LDNAIQCIRSVFKHALDADLIAAPVRSGPGFKRPTKKVLCLHRAERERKLFTTDEIRAFMEGALVVGEQGPQLVQPDPQLKAMILLGINCGFGMADCGKLPLSALDLDEDWVDYPRPKTGILRRCPLWPETVAAVREALAHRQEPKDAAHGRLVFLTARGHSWHRETGGGVRRSEVPQSATTMASSYL
jgi:integrase